MSHRQLLFAWATGAFIALACLVPPWEYTFQAQGISQVRKPAGYSLLFIPPAPERDNARFGVAIDFGRLGAELLVISVIGGLGILSAGRKLVGGSEAQVMRAQHDAPGGDRPKRL